MGDRDQTRKTNDFVQHDFDLSKSPMLQNHTVTSSPILDFGDQGFLLHNVFTPTECQQIVEESEGLGFGPTGFPKSYRDSERIIVKSKKLSELIWERISCFILPMKIKDPEDSHVYSFNVVKNGKSPLTGRWEPYGINEMYRICRYFEGGYFKPHHDGFYGKSASDRSLKTCMFYLNDEFEAGATNFLSDGGGSLSDQRVYSVKPETGMALVFNHSRLHEGEALQGGRKYILRTDIMYRKTS